MTPVGTKKGETLKKSEEPPTPKFLPSRKFIKGSGNKKKTKPIIPKAPPRVEEEKETDIDLEIHIVPPTRYKFERDQPGQKPGDICMNFSFPRLSKTTGEYHYESQFINIPKSVASQLKAFLIVSKTKVLEIEE